MNMMIILEAVLTSIYAIGFIIVFSKRRGAIIEIITKIVVIVIITIVTVIVIEISTMSITITAAMRSSPPTGAAL
jgi:hypothetical protein